MRTTAKINKRATAINCAILPVDEVIDVMQLVLAVREHLLEIVLGDFESLKRLLLLTDAR